ncbi:MAG: SDR family oxidoreductase [Frankiaceae bacterium]|jgi:NAD(P)-dependent dehydrogenase (short-subunit alcohol dehydrogenase family)|nr:SDR family oxidoreductase [Frankiaceae bacterium]
MSGADRFDVGGKVVVITGGTKGLGRAFALGLAEAGAKIVVSSRKQELCEQVAREIAEQTGAQTLGLACHVGEWDAIPAFVDRVCEHFGRVDGLINNAGISPAFVDLVDMQEAYWDKVFSTNLKGPLRMSALIAPRMREAGGGSIINISSIGGYRGAPRNSHYSASKGALVRLTESMAAEWAPWGIRVNVVSPGPFMTTLLEGMGRNQPEGLAATARGNLLQRIADPDEAVGLIQFLLSDASAFITGADHEISGGRGR